MALRARNPSMQARGSAATRKRGAPERRTALPCARSGGAEAAKCRATAGGSCGATTHVAAEVTVALHVRVKLGRA
eukprot:11991-Alexandrium_andersonii.AAC.1